MKLVDVQLGRVTQLHVADEVRPLKTPYYPDGLRLFVERYGFVNHSPVQEAINSGVKFQHGRLVAKGETITIIELALFSDGIIATTRETRGAELVLEDVIAWSRETFGARPPITKRPRIFWSNVVVEFDHGLERSLGILERANEAFRAAFFETYGVKHDTAVTRVAFGSDPGKPIPDVRPDFIIERRADIPLANNRYFCSGPLRTEALLKFLQLFEKPKRRKKLEG